MEHTQIKYLLDNEVHFVDIKGLTQKEVGTIIKFLEVNKILNFEYVIEDEMMYSLDNKQYKTKEEAIAMLGVLKVNILLDSRIIDKEQEINKLIIKEVKNEEYSTNR